ncbi:MAG: type II secretion system protein [Sedimentisphaeraceae bacterium JB056]
MKKRAFTLIELLVVISIIAILMAVMIPALGRARESAKSVVCRANLKQIGVVLGLYGEDYNNKLPYPKQFSNWMSWYTMEGKYVEALTPYVGKEGSDTKYGSDDEGQSLIFKCANDPIGDNLGFDQPYHRSSYAFTYNYRGTPLSGPTCTCGDPDWDWHISSTSLAKTVLYTEAGLIEDGGPLKSWHSGKKNYLFADMHAKDYGVEEVVKDFNYYRQ